MDAGLERGDLVLQLGKITLENLSPAALAGGSRLDPAQRLRDRVIFLFEPFEAAINLVEVPEHVLTQPGDLTLQGIEAIVDRRELVAEELDQLRVFGRSHELCLTCLVVPCKCVRLWTDKGTGRTSAP